MQFQLVMRGFSMNEAPKIDEESKPSVQVLTAANPAVAPQSPAEGSAETPSSPDWEAFQVSAIKTATENKPAESISPKYLKLIQKYPSLLKPDFRDVKHSVEHAIETHIQHPPFVLIHSMDDSGIVRHASCFYIPGCKSCHVLQDLFAYDCIPESMFIQLGADVRGTATGS